MDNSSEISHDYWLENKKVFSTYLNIFIGIAILLVGYILFKEKYNFLFFLFGAVFYFIAVTQPKFAFYQFLFFLFTNIAVTTNPFVLILDMSGVILVSAAVFDFLLRGSEIKNLPVLFGNIILLITALIITAVMGYNFNLSVTPILKVIFLAAIFLSIVHLAKYVNLDFLIKSFFWLAIVHAFIAILPIWFGGDAGRLFGFSRATLDDFLMISIPIGVFLFLQSQKYRGGFYLMGIAVAFIALIATQSRLSLVFTFVFSFIAVFIYYKKFLKLNSINKSFDFKIIKRLFKKRILLLMSGIIISLTFLLLFQSNLIEAVLVRFERLITTTPGGTFMYRVALWKAALTAFSDNPIFGIGPGHFRTIHELYQELHFDYVFAYLKGFSAHNLFLHYLAETGLTGTIALVALMANQFRIARKSWRKSVYEQRFYSSILYLLSIIFLITTFVESGWMWGQMSYLFIFFIALISKGYSRQVKV